jgi:SAM-dependent methyltransferase
MLNLTEPAISDAKKIPLNKAREDNKLRMEDRSAHDWYRFVLSYPAHIVRTYIERFGLDAKDKVLDPFCGTGTTIVECKKLGIPSFGVDPNPVAVFASRTKVDWEVDADQLSTHATQIAKLTLEKFDEQGIQDQEDFSLFGKPAKPQVTLRGLSPELTKLLLTDSISPLPLHKVLILLEVLEKNREPRLLAHEHIALPRNLWTRE